MDEVESSLFASECQVKIVGLRSFPWRPRSREETANYLFSDIYGPIKLRIGTQEKFGPNWSDCSKIAQFAIPLQQLTQQKGLRRPAGTRPASRSREHERKSPCRSEAAHDTLHRQGTRLPRGALLVVRYRLRKQTKKTVMQRVRGEGQGGSWWKPDRRWMTCLA